VDHEQLMTVLRSLEDHGVRYVIFGGIALNLHGLARATEDIDLFVAPEAENIERLKSALHAIFDDPSIDEITAADLLGDYPAVQYVPPDGSFHVDILTRLGDAYTFEALSSERLPFAGLNVPVVTARMLYDMKKGTVRLKDKADAEMLRRRFGPEVE
jgi:voltage-gated potassium channel Kch